MSENPNESPEISDENTINIISSDNNSTEIAEKDSSKKLDTFNSLILIIVFVAVAALLAIGFSSDETLATTAQKIVYPFLIGVLLSGLATFFMYTQMVEVSGRIKNLNNAYTIKERPKWFFPLFSGIIALICIIIAYSYLGVYPVGTKTILTVDMHHQYAPLLAQFRTMVLEGKNLFYSFEIGLGTSLLPIFAYYFSSPLNFLLTLFPANMLTEGILFITIIKIVLSSVFFAMCVQYIFKKRALYITITSVAYALMMYMIAYSWNIMWLDVVMILPLVIMAYEHMMKKGKFLPYTLLLAYALFANYYIAFMLAIFLVLYHFVYLLREKREMDYHLRATGRFALSSVIAGGLVMFLLIPVAISLKNTSAAGGSLPDLAANFPMFDLLGRHLYNTSPTIRSGNLPNIYCGILSVVLLPIFFTLKSIPKRKRIAYGALLGTLAFSFVINSFDLFWHGFHSPNDLPYRFSFLYSFVLLLITTETLFNINKIKIKQAFSSLGLLLLFLVFLEKFGEEEYGFTTIYVSLVFAAIYVLAIWLVKRKHLSIFATYSLILLITVAELTINTGSTLITLNGNEHFTSRESYIDSDIGQTVGKAVDRAKEIGVNDTDNGFYRLEFAPRRTTVDTALYNYKGISVFASSNPQNQVKFMGGLGYAVNGVNSHLYKNFVPTTDSILNIEYVILDKSDAQETFDYLEYVDSVKGEDNEYTIYKNKAALPLGFFVNDAALDWAYTEYDPVNTQNSFFNSLTNTSNNVFLYNNDLRVNDESLEYSSATEGRSISITDTGEEDKISKFETVVENPGQVFAFVDARSADEISISGNSEHFTMNGYEPFMVNLGEMSAGEIVSVDLTTDGASSGNIYVVTLDKQAFDSHIETLRKNPLVITSHSQTKIKGTVTAPQKGLIFTSIPYDAGWTIKVDGKKVETQSVNDAMLAFEVDSGSHDVEFSFFPKGLGIGTAVTLVSIMALIFLYVQTKKDRLMVATKEAAEADLSAKEKDIIEAPKEESELTDNDLSSE